MTIVFKICSRAEWAAAEVAGHLAGTADDRRDGYIHLSTAEQLPGTLARHFAGRDDLVLAAYEAAGLGSALRWEPSRGGQLFPHLYGPLAPATALATWPLAGAGPGQPPRLPAGLPADPAP